MQRAGKAGSFEKVSSRFLPATLRNVSEYIPSVTREQDVSTHDGAGFSIDGQRSPYYPRLRAASPLGLRTQHLVPEGPPTRLAALGTLSRNAGEGGRAQGVPSRFEGSTLRPPSRDLRLDFFRGLALIFIFIDHIPENILSYFTLQAVQFFDAAEVFIFISGYTAALVYGRALGTQGAGYATAQALRRAWQLYVAHIFLFVIFIAEVSYIVTTFKNPMYNEEMRVADFLEEPHIAVVKALTLQFQPTFLDILPLYILLLLIFPIILIGLRLHPA